MTVEELTAIATAHQSAISRHDQEMAEFRAALRQSSEQHRQEMAEFRQEMAQFRETMQQNSDRHDQKDDSIQRLADLNQEQLNLLTAGLLALRTLVADYLQGRSQT